MPLDAKYLQLSRNTYTIPTAGYPAPLILVLLSEGLVDLDTSGNIPDYAFNALSTILCKLLQ